MKSFDLQGRETHTFTLNKVCEDFGYKNRPLVEAQGVKRVDCMGDSVSANNFCLKYFQKNNQYTRGYIDLKTDKVICETAGKVTLEYDCTGKQNKYCKNSLSACRMMKAQLAQNHIIAQHSLVEDSEGKSLNCYFEAQHETAQSNYNEDALKILKSIY